MPVGTAFDRAVANVQWAPDGRSLLFTAEDRGRTGVWRLAAGATRPTLVVPGGTVGGFAQSKDGGTIVCDRSSSQHPPALFACAGDGSDERALESTNAALLARHALGETREITVKGWGGEPVQVWHVYPPGFDPTRKWPLMHSIHGGPHAEHGDVWHFRWNAQAFAGRGYVVAMVNYHGAFVFGQAVLETIVARYGEKEFAHIEAATDHLLRAGYVDRTRLVATGGSYGGQRVSRRELNFQITEGGGVQVFGGGGGKGNAIANRRRDVNMGMRVAGIDDINVMNQGLPRQRRVGGRAIFSIGGAPRERMVCPTAKSVLVSGVRMVGVGAVFRVPPKTDGEG